MDLIDDEILTSELRKILEDNFYTDLCIKKFGTGEPMICGLQRMIFTVALCYGLDETGFMGKYCFHTAHDARQSLKHWTGGIYPPGDWIKHAGYIGHFRNPQMPDGYP